MRLRLFYFAPLFLGPAFVQACVGDDPSPATSASPDAATSYDDAALESGPTDAGPPAPCRLDLPFNAPAVVPGLELIGSVARFSPNELTAYFAYYPTDASTVGHLYKATRPNLTAAFGTPTAITALNGSGENSPTVTADGKTLFYAEAQPDGGTDGVTLYEGTADSVTGDFKAPTEVPGVNAVGFTNYQPFIGPNLDLWFVSDRAGSSQIYVALYTGAGFGTPVIENEVNSASLADQYPMMSADDLTLYFGRRDAAGNFDIWVASRPTPSSDFATPTMVSELTTSDTIDRPSGISTDGCRIYIGRGKVSNAIEMYVAEKPAK